MIPAIALLGLSILIILYPIFTGRREARALESALPTRSTEMSDKLMEVAVEAIKNRRIYRAEKALLTLLKIDERNATAYNRLGILYAKQKQYNEAIECFEIANGLEPNAASLHNAGLIYYELENYEKAALMFAQAIELEGDAAVHYTALAKAELKLGNRLKAIKALESAYDIAPSIALLRSIQQIHTSIDNTEAVAALDKRIIRFEAELVAKSLPARKSPSIKSTQRKLLRRKAQLRTPH